VNFRNYDYSYDGSGYATVILTTFGIPQAPNGSSPLSRFTRIIPPAWSWLNLISNGSLQLPPGGINSRSPTSIIPKPAYRKAWPELGHCLINMGQLSQGSIRLLPNNMFKTHFQWDWNPLNSTGWIPGIPERFDFRKHSRILFQNLDLLPITTSSDTAMFIFISSEPVHRNMIITTWILDQIHGPFQEEGYTLMTYGNNTIRLIRHTIRNIILDIISSWEFLFNWDWNKRKPGILQLHFCKSHEAGRTINCANLYPGNDYTLILLV